MVKVANIANVDEVDPRIPIPRSRAIIPWRKYYVRHNPAKGGRLVHKNVRTICEVIREIYSDARKRNDALMMEKCEEATDMAKRMQARLVHYSGLFKEGDVYLAKVNGERRWMTKNEFKEADKPRRR